jgi:hypothetical protein
MAEGGRFEGLKGNASYAEINGFFEADLEKRLQSKS